MTNAKVFVLPLANLNQILEKHPKIRYYAKRWTQWELMREYILVYTELYYTAARRGSQMNPPLLSRRPNVPDGDFDDIDVAVIDHINDVGY